MNDRKVMSLIGLSMKAGKVVSGSFAVEKAVKTGKACLVIVAREASANTRKDLHNLCTWYHVPCYEFADKSQLGQAIGKEYRATLAVTDENLASALEKLLNQEPKA